MQRKKWLSIFVLASLFLMSVGWASAQDVTPEATSAPLELSQHFVSDDEKVIFEYPAGWILDLRDPSAGYYVDGRLLSSPDIDEQDFAIFGDGLKSGEVYMQPLVADKIALVTEIASGITLESSMADILEKVLEFNTDENVASSAITALEVDGKPAARLDVTTRNGGAGYILLWELNDDVIAGLSVGAPANELEQWESTALAIAESITFAGESNATPEATAESTAVPVAELTQTAKSENESVVVKYPEGWVAESPTNSEVDIAPDEESLDLSFGDAVKSGQVKILIQIDTTQNLIDSMELPLESDASVEKMLQAAIKAASADGGIEFSAVTSTTVDDEAAAFMQFTGPGFEGLAWVVEHETFARMLVQVIAAPGEADQWKDLTLAVAAEAAYPG